MRDAENTNLDSVKRFWEANPLGSIESPVDIGSKEFFDWHDTVRQADEGEFASHLYEFDKHAGELVLDIGCGNGWLVTNFAKGGAKIYGFDLTNSSINLTKHRIAYHGLSANLSVANAEELPFKSNVFDYVTSAGVLHHTPNTKTAIQEAIRVTKSGGRGMISLYYKHILLSPLLWPITRFLVHIMFSRVPGRSKFSEINNPDDLVRVYDGNNNPIGKAYSRKDINSLFKEVSTDTVELHFFPMRFLMPSIPKWLRYVTDRFFGLMIYTQYTKK
jgi:ubiquinone/menaquinone biosynthesis C-methylase UbiE